MTKPQVGRGDEYFAVNDKPQGVSTSFRVSGRLGELARRFARFPDAWADCKRLNKAYRLGFKHGAAAVELIEPSERAET